MDHPHVGCLHESYMNDKIMTFIVVLPTDITAVFSTNGNWVEAIKLEGENVAQANVRVGFSVCWH